MPQLDSTCKRRSRRIRDMMKIESRAGCLPPRSPAQSSGPRPGSIRALPPPRFFRPTPAMLAGWYPSDPRRGERGQEYATNEVRRAGLAHSARSRRRQRGLHRPHTDPAARHPCRPRRPRLDRLRPDRHRQDRGLPAADPATSGRGPALAAPACAGRHADPRAGRPDRGDGEAIRAPSTSAQRRHLRRCRHGAAAATAGRRPRSAGRDTGTTARPSRSQAGVSGPRRDPRPRRGGPDARHGLSSRCAAHPRHAAIRSVRTCSSRPRCRTRSRTSSDGRPTRRR